MRAVTYRVYSDLSLNLSTSLKQTSSVSRRLIGAYEHRPKNAFTKNGCTCTRLLTTMRKRCAAESLASDLDNPEAIFQRLTDPTQLVDALMKRTLEMMTNSSSEINDDHHHVVAFSGGVDSSMVAYLLQNNSEASKVRAILGLSPAVSSDQVEMACHIANDIIGIPFTSVQTDEGSDPLYIENTGRACYVCKTHLYRTLDAIVREANKENKSYVNSITLYNGTNADDLKDATRVGLLAAQEAKVLSPLSVITKEQVRIAAKHVGLPNHNAAASPCLRSRLAMGVKATQQHLEAVELAERHVRTLLNLPPSMAMRVRMLTNQRARIELEHINNDYIAILNNSDIQSIFHDLGFTGGFAGVKAFATGSVATKKGVHVWKEIVDQQ